MAGAYQPLAAGVVLNQEVLALVAVVLVAHQRVHARRETVMAVRRVSAAGWRCVSPRTVEGSERSELALEPTTERAASLLPALRVPVVRVAVVRVAVAVHGVVVVRAAQLAAAVKVAAENSQGPGA